MMNDLRTKLITFWVKNRSLIVGLLIFFIAVELRFAYLENTIVKNPISGDAKKYVGYATNIVLLGIYSQELTDNPKPDTQVTPGYPFFLAAIMILSKNFKAFYVNVLSIQAIIGALTAVLAFMIGMNLVPFGLAALAGIFTAFSPHLITMVGYVLTETFFTFLSSLGLWLLFVAYRKKKLALYLMASIVFGLASLVRPALLLFPVFISILVFFYLKPTRRVLIVFLILIGVFSTMLPWSLWTKYKTTKTNKAGLALSSLVFGSYPDLINKDPTLKGFPYQEDPQYNAMTKDLRFALKTIANRAAEDPIKYLKWYLFGKPLMFWNWGNLVGQEDIYIYSVKSSLYKTNHYAEMTRLGMKHLHPIFMLMALSGFIIMILPFRRWENPPGTKALMLFLYSFLIYFTLVHTVFTPLPRYAIPLRPMLYVGALIFLKRLFSLGKSHDIVIKNSKRAYST
jgi:4-amino-4-deoxy-L-arabinose transferase-like glycosyltransferase